MKRGAAAVSKGSNPFSVLDSESDSDAEAVSVPVAEPVRVDAVIPAVETEVGELRSRWAAADALKEKKSAVFFKRNTHAFPEKVGDIFTLAAFHKEKGAGNTPSQSSTPSWKPSSPSLAAVVPELESSIAAVPSLEVAPASMPVPVAPKTMAMRIKESLDAVERERVARATAARSDTWPAVSSEERLTSIRRSLENLSFRATTRAPSSTNSQ